MASKAQWEPRKPALINFWFTACPPGIIEMPVLNMLEENYGDQVPFLSNLPVQADKRPSFLEKYAFHFTHPLGGKKFLQTIQAICFPKNVILDGNSIVVALLGGMPRKKDSEGRLEETREWMDVWDALIGKKDIR